MEGLFLLTTERVTIRMPDDTDGGSLWRVARDSGKLDLNTPYCYLLLGKYFRRTCAVAELEGGAVGFVTGFRHPERQDTWFVWQIAVDASARGRGLARRLLEHVLRRPENADIRYVEATVSPSNVASRALFLGFARDAGVDCDIRSGFEAEQFPDGAHEKEELYRIGPISYQT